MFFILAVFVVYTDFSVVSIFWVKSPLTKVLLVLYALALLGLHILLAQPAIEGGDFACLQHGSPPFRRQASMVMY
jgi:hypothetical protein